MSTVEQRALWGVAAERAWIGTIGSAATEMLREAVPLLLADVERLEWERDDQRARTEKAESAIAAGIGDGVAVIETLGEMLEQGDARLAAALAREGEMREAIEALDMAATQNYTDDETIHLYIVPAGRWHRLLALARGASGFRALADTGQRESIYPAETPRAEGAEWALNVAQSRSMGPLSAGGE